MIGYSGLSGPANQTLAALAQFGLVERAGKGEMRVTARAQEILHPNNEEEKRIALRSAAFEPTLFRDLQDRWPDMIPPEDGVVTYLNRQGFNQSAIRPATRAYLQTLHYLQEAGASESHGVSQSPAPESDSSDLNVEPTTVQPAPLSPAAAPSQQRPPQTLLDSGPAVGLNKINMNVQGDRVHISAFLDLKGVAALEKKLANLKLLLEADPDLAEGGATLEAKEV
jgi:hypothetical protein